MKPNALFVIVVWLLCAGEAFAQTAAPSSSADPAPPASTARPSPAPSASASAAPREPAPRPAYADLDRRTPRQTVSGFLRRVEAGDLGRAAQYLDLRGLRWGVQTPEQAAAQMGELLTQHVWVSVDKLSDLPEGRADDGADVEHIGSLRVDGSDVAITLSRVQRGGQALWLFSEQTVARLPDLYRELGAPTWLEPIVPETFETTRFAGMWSWQWLALLLALVVVVPLGYLAASALIGALLPLAKRTAARWDDAALVAVRPSLRIVFGLAGFAVVSQSLGLPGRVAGLLRTAVAIPIILVSGFAVMRAVHAVIDAYTTESPGKAELETRGVRTHLVILRRLTTATIGLVTIAVALTRFAIVRDLGLSLLASAGVAGVALGFAAQKSLGAVIAGLQLSITQPVRIGDAIVWQGQWGIVEEITLTWVRLKLYDERRLVVPVDKFLVEPFENWSMPGTEMIGTIELAVDPTAPIPKLRAELERLAAEHPAHDGRDCRLQLVDVDERRALLRARVSTADVGEAFTMRCDLREALIAYLHRLDGGRHLPRQRWQDVAGGGSDARAA